MIKLIATDVDGTLVKESTGSLYPEMFEVIEELLQQGIYFCVASGRTYESLKKMFHKVSDKILFIAENGAHIVYKGKELSVTYMDCEVTRKIIEDLDQYKAPFQYVVSTDKGSLIGPGSQDEFYTMLTQGYQNIVERTEHFEPYIGSIIKIAMYHPGSIRTIGEEVLIPRWGKEVKTCMAGEEWVDFMDSSVDKGNALHFLQEYFNITPKETMSFGDNGNDIGLMKQAGESYAVENAILDVKKAAKYQCPSYEKKGVYMVLKSLVMEGGKKDA